MNGNDDEDGFGDFGDFNGGAQATPQPAAASIQDLLSGPVAVPDSQ